jgi:hypothetical protein
MGEDKLTPAQRIRLEAFAQAGARHSMRALPLAEHFAEAAAIEEWLRAADAYWAVKGGGRECC